jgi:hypothetical protein
MWVFAWLSLFDASLCDGAVHGKSQSTFSLEAKDRLHAVT